MKRVSIFYILLTASLIIGLLGCSSDDDVLSPGDPQDPRYLDFVDEFSGMDDQTGDMVELTFMFMKDIMEGLPAKNIVKKPQFGLEYIIEYHETSGYWFVSGAYMDANGGDTLSFELVDSLSFRHGDQTVQFPDEDSITFVHSVFTLYLAGQSVVSGEVTQDISITISEPGSQWLSISGTGIIGVHLEYEDIIGTDTASCYTALSYGIAYSNVVLDRTAIDNSVDLSAGDAENDLPCPESGAINFNGIIMHSCSTAAEDDVETLNGVWNVSQTFANGNVTVTVTSGNTSWSVTEDCDG